MLAVWRTCRTLHDIIAGTTYLQYLLRAEMNGVEDLLPPSVPYSKRLELLRRHEESWCGLHVNLFTQQSVPSLDDADCFILQGGYLIYECLMTSERRYGYTDLCSAARNEELRWVHVTITLAFPMGGIRSFISAGGIFAVDHDLVIFTRFCVVSDPFSSEKPDMSQQSARQRWDYRDRSCLL